MITDAILGFFFGLAEFVVGLLPDFAAPEWMTTTLPGWIGQASSYISGVDALFPFSHAATVLGFVMAGCATALLVKLTRIVASFVTMGGGSAA